LPPVSSFLDHLRRELRSIDEQGLRRRLREVRGRQQAVISLDGRSVVNFSSNNYLGLADHPALAEASHRAIEQHGVGAGASRLIVGNLDPHHRFEAAVAEFHEVEAALLFSSGYQANVGVLSALAGPGDVIFSDSLNHASIVDGCRLSRAKTVVYPHVDVVGLRALLESHPGTRRFIVTDTIFSMDGDLAPLVELRALANEHQAVLIIDEAHATGVLGPSGRGLAAAVGVQADVHIATLGKSFGTFGAYVCGARPLIDFLLHRARSFVFTTSLPPAVVTASQTALALIETDAGMNLRARLSAHIGRFAKGLKELGRLAPGAGKTPIFPVHIGDEARTMKATEALLARGIYAQGVRPPTVAKGTSRLRFALMATHTDEHITGALAALRALAAEGLL
jgi:8-amino-7-oxononanoate synthase